MSGDLASFTDEDLMAELVGRGAALRVGYCYPAMCSDEANSKLVEQFGYEHGPWQFLELGHRLSEPPQWPMYAFVPSNFRRPVSDIELGGPDGPIGPVSQLPPCKETG